VRCTSEVKIALHVMNIQSCLTADYKKGFSGTHFFHLSLYQDGTKWVCTARDVPGTKTSGRNGKRESGYTNGPGLQQKTTAPK
jgi:hypothetical protein